MLGEVGRGSGKARRGAHGANLRGDPHLHPRQPQGGRPGGHHAAGGMGGPPPGRGPGPPPLPTFPEPSANGSRPPDSRPGPSAPPLHPTTTTTGRERARARGEEGTERKTPARGHGRAQRDRQPTIGTEHRERHNVGAGNHPRARKGEGTGTGPQRKRTPRRAPGPTHKKGIPRRRDQRPATPSGRHTTPWGRTPPTHAAEARIGRHTDHTGTRLPATGNHTGDGGHTYTGRTGHSPKRKPPGTPPRSPPPRPHRQATTPATTRATSQAPEEEEGMATAPRARDRDSQRTQDHGTGPQGGQPHGRLPNPPA